MFDNKRSYQSCITVVGIQFRLISANRFIWTVILQNRFSDYFTSACNYFGCWSLQFRCRMMH